MNTTIQQQPSSKHILDVERNAPQTTKSDDALIGKRLPVRDHFPKGLRGGGACFDCLACLCFCCALEEIACFECCRDC